MNNNCIYKSIRVLLFQNVESSNCIRLRNEVVFRTVDDELRCRPICHKVHRIISTNVCYVLCDSLLEIILAIKSEFPNNAITLSLGERSYESYKKMFDAGADRYLPGSGPEDG